MKFGKVPFESLHHLSLSLPHDHENNARILTRTKGEKLNIRFGCTAWVNKDWIGKIYPKGSKQKDFLQSYSQQFNTIELNSCHYRIPSIDQVQKWANVVADTFEFCPKVYQAISHWDRLNDTRGTTERFCDSIAHFEGNLGPSFLQMHPKFKPKEFGTLEAYLNRWPKGFPLALELRDPNWFLDQQVSDDLFQLLEKKKVIPIITDTAAFRDLVHMRLSTPKAMIRFVGNQLHSSDFNRINEWITRIKNWSDLGLTDCWFFMHQHEEMHSPTLIKYMAEKLKELGIEVKVPHIIEEPETLF